VLHFQETQRRSPLRDSQKGIRRGQRRPGHGQGAEVMCLWIMETDPPLAPRLASREEHKGVAEIGMEGVRDGEAYRTMGVIGCS
jgi:hypothetical protein